LRPALRRAWVAPEQLEAFKREAAAAATPPRGLLGRVTVVLTASYRLFRRTA